MQRSVLAWNVIFGNYFPREVIATFRTRDEAEAYLEQHQRENSYMLEIEEVVFDAP